MFIDETATSTNMARPRGRAKRGCRLIGRVPHGHWKITTFVAGLRCDGMSAPFVIDRPMNSAIFLAYVQRCLVPTLVPGDIVILDNLKPHKAKGVREAIEAAGATLRYLPPYSPTSTRSNSPSPSSKRCCAKPPNAQSRRCGAASANFSTATALGNAPTTSATTDTLQNDRNPL